MLSESDTPRNKASFLQFGASLRITSSFRLVPISAAMQAWLWSAPLRSVAANRTSAEQSIRISIQPPVRDRDFHGTWDQITDAAACADSITQIARRQVQPRNLHGLDSVEFGRREMRCQ